ncbi:MAG: hypothetical protein JO184_03025 [Gammaproteobacteria bacterium]|nr:hypothetical protein [Gammaproteobacteria bacterium]
MSDSRKRFPREQPPPPDERRRIGTVVHDERGNGSIEWRAAPPDEERQVLELLGDEGLVLKKEEVSYDPYSRSRPGPAGGGKRTDLRKLSEWIKQMRELENRKRAAPESDEEER